MRIKIKLPYRAVRKLRKQLRQYAKEREEENWEDFGGRFYEDGSKTTVLLTTGNQWTVDIKEKTLEYDGSREGFHSFTPFRGSKIKPEVRIVGNRAVFIVTELDDDLFGIVKEYAGELISYKTSYPLLEWWERIRRIEQEPNKAVTVYPDGWPRRLVPYSFWRSSPKSNKPSGSDDPSLLISHSPLHCIGGHYVFSRSGKSVEQEAGHDVSRILTWLGWQT